MKVVSYLKIHLNNYFHGVGQGEQTFSVKGQMAVILDLAGHMISILLL